MPLAYHSGFMCPSCKNACSSLIAVGDTDLEGVVVEPCNRGTSSTTIEFLLKKLEQGTTVCQTSIRPAEDAVWIPDRVVQMLDLDTAGVADLKLGKWEGANPAGTVEAECVSEVRAPGSRGAAFVVGNGDFFACRNVTDCMDGLAI